MNPDSDLESLKDLKRLLRAHGVRTKVRWHKSWDKVGATNWITYGPSHIRYKLTSVTFSSTLWPTMTHEERFSVAVHEIAHALLHPHEEHGEEWAALCISLGGNGKPNPW